MKKRLLATLLLLAMVIGLCGTIASAAEPAEYRVGYGKVDITPYYDASVHAQMLQSIGEKLLSDKSTCNATLTESKNALAALKADEAATEAAIEAAEKAVSAAQKAYNAAESEYAAYEKYCVGLKDGDVLPLPLQGNSYTSLRLALRTKLDDNGNGIPNETDPEGNSGDGIFATAIAVTDPNGETVIMIATDLIGMNGTITAAVRKALFEKHDITGDRVMINGSHSHHGVCLGKVSDLNSACHALHEQWYTTTLCNKLVECAEEALDDRSVATMSKGTIEANEAEVKSQAVGDKLNEVRALNKLAYPDDAKYRAVEYVTVLEPEQTGTPTGADSEGHSTWTQTDSWTDGTNTISAEIKHVYAPEMFAERTYNGVRHYQVTSQDVLRTVVRSESGSYYYYDFKQYGDAGYPATDDHPKGTYVIDEESPKVTYAGGDNFNTVQDVGHAAAAESYWVDYDGNRLADSEVVDSDGNIYVYANRKTLGQPYIKGTNNEKKAYYVPDMKVVTAVDHATPTDQTLLILRFDFEQAGKAPVLLINWRAHTNKNRKTSIDYMAEYTEVGFYESFFQVSSDWINAFRYTLEQEGFRVAYFNGAAGNVNPGSKITAESAWMNYAPKEKDENGNVVAGTAENSLEGQKLEDTSYAKNVGAIYGTELAEVALELLNGENATFKMTAVTPDENDGGLRVLQSVYQTRRKTASIDEYLAAGQFRSWDYQDSLFNGKGPKTYTGYYWVDVNGNPLVDHKTNSGWSFYDEDGEFNEDHDGKSQGTGVLYTSEDVTAHGYTPLTDEQKQNPETYRKTYTYTIASYLHAADAVATYGLTTVGTQVELNAIMLCDDIAILTGPGEFFDRYSTAATWSSETGVNCTDNAWRTLWSDNTLNTDSYDEPFFLGYCNGSTGYMPSKVTYEYSTGAPGRSIGSYETQTTNFAQGTGEEVMVQFSRMLGIVNSTSTSAYKGECKYCQEEVEWRPISEWTNNSVDLTNGHYYVDESKGIDEATINAGHIVCLELNGNTLTGSERAFTVSDGGILNIQDSGEGGKVQGQGFSEPQSGRNYGANGGTVNIASGGILNLYSGMLDHDQKLAYKPGNGGVVDVSGTFNMYGGTIRGGDSGWIGGNICVARTENAVFNMYGGEVIKGSGGGIGTTKSCNVVVRGSVLLAKEAKINELTLYPDSVPLGEMLTISGTYTGNATLYFHNISATVGEGLDIGTSDDANLTGATLTVNGYDLCVVVDGTDIKLAAPAVKVAEVVAADGTSEGKYDTVEAAIAKCPEPNIENNVAAGRVVLLEDVEDITVSKNVTLDLNGKNITGTATVEENVTLSVMDSATADYDIKDNVYGKIANVAGKGTVIGAEATANHDVYLMIEEDDGTSFHAIGLNLIDMNLRSEVVGMYFKANFNGDELVKGKVASFGVAMSTVGAPTAERMGDDVKYTRLTVDFGSKDAPNTSSILQNIMKTSQGSITNLRNAKIQVYGRAYVQLKDGTYVFGYPQNRSLQQLVQIIDYLWNADNNKDGITDLVLTEKQLDDLLAMYKTYSGVMNKWEIPQLKAYAETQ